MKKWIIGLLLMSCSSIAFAQPISDPPAPAPLWLQYVQHRNAQSASIVFSVAATIGAIYGFSSAKKANDNAHAIQDAMNILGLQESLPWRNARTSWITKRNNYRALGVAGSVLAGVGMTVAIREGAKANRIQAEILMQKDHPVVVLSVAF